MKTLPTWYQGIKFRSRLEARWAIFLDNIGVKWEYEQEGFDLGGKLYLPDFKIYNILYRGVESPIWLEIKDRQPTKEELLKITLLGEQTSTPSFIVSGSPYLHRDNWWIEECHPFPDYDMGFMVCRDCMTVKIDYTLDSHNLVCEKCGGKTGGKHDIVTQAIKKSRQFFYTPQT